MSREELMMVLAGLEQLQIRALFPQTSATVSLRRVVLEVAGEAGRGPPASNVELCMCPANYRGDSCQVKSGEGGCLATKVLLPWVLARVYVCQHLPFTLSYLCPHVSSSLLPCQPPFQSAAPSSPVSPPFITATPPYTWLPSPIIAHSVTAQPSSPVHPSSQQSPPSPLLVSSCLWPWVVQHDTLEGL